MVGFADRLILSSDAVRSFAKRTMLLRNVNSLPRPAKRVPPCRRRGSYCAADNRGLREASPEARHRSPTAKCCRCFAADQRAAYPPCDWFDGTRTGQKPPTDFRGPSPWVPGPDVGHLPGVLAASLNSLAESPQPLTCLNRSSSRSDLSFRKFHKDGAHAVDTVPLFQGYGQRPRSATNRVAIGHPATADCTSSAAGSAPVSAL